MIIKGKCRKFGNDVNTDLIISGRYKFKTLDMKELAKHVFEDLDENFYSDAQKKGINIVVAGRNFGCGSSREQAPLAIKNAGIDVVVAESFARIFYRNAINVGLPIVVGDTTGISDGDVIDLDTDKGLMFDETKKIKMKADILPEFMMEILNDGGLIEHLNKGKGFL